MIINGKHSNLSGQTLEACLAQLGLEGSRLAIEINGQIIPQASYAHHLLQEDDVIELIQFVGGG